MTSKLTVLSKTVKLLAIAFIIGGIVSYIVTGHDIFMRIGMIGFILCWFVGLLLLAFEIIRGLIRKKKLFMAIALTALYGGIELLVIYFLWLCLSEMLDVRFFGSISPVKSSKLAIAGGSLIGLSVISLFAEAIYNRIKNSSCFQK